ncbi:MAG: hypothetical protein ABIU05_09315 [Nitrospirales bacterium]
MVLNVTSEQLQMKLTDRSPDIQALEQKRCGKVSRAWEHARARILGTETPLAPWARKKAAGERRNPTGQQEVTRL